MNLHGLCRLRYTLRRSLTAAAFLPLLLVIFSIQAYGGSGEVTFVWQANPADENIIGYRLYYGPHSRFADSLKNTSAPYDYYIDLADEKRCVADSGGSDCEPLRSGDMQCDNLYGDSPACTLFNLQEGVYVAMTAYNAQAESGFTRELSVRRSGSNLLLMITPLLLK
ncbi:MAG: hypothetical protein SCH71_09645 [Desulfobulbaceae bacterium]|nr:hypothetical protein [Desulfobulbaceae bacterium]